MAVITKSIGSAKDYATVTAWEAASYGATGSDNAVGEVYGVVTEGAAVVLNDSTPISITLQSAAGERHDGTKGSGATLKASGSPFSWFTLSTSGIVVQGLEFDGDDLNHAAMLLCGSSCTIAENILYGMASSRAQDGGVIYHDSGYDALNIFDNIICDSTHSNSFVFAGIILKNTISNTVKVYNNTIVNLDNSGGSGTAHGILMQDASGFEYKNNLVQDITASGGGTALDYSDDSISTATSATNASEDSSSPDGASYRNISVSFTNAGAGDYTLAADPAIDGTDLGGDCQCRYNRTGQRF